jgi:hypothetical protein
MAKTKQIKGFYSDFSDFFMCVLQLNDFQCARCNRTVSDKLGITPCLKGKGLPKDDSDSFICLCEDCAAYERKNRVDGLIEEEMYCAGFLSDEIRNILK